MRRTFAHTRAPKTLRDKRYLFGVGFVLAITLVILWMVSGVTQFLPIGRVVQGDQVRLVLNHDEGHPAVVCSPGVLKVVVTKEAPLYPEPNVTSPPIGMAEGGHIVCTTEIRNGWWKIAVPAAGGTTASAWVAPETFSPVTIDLSGNVVGGLATTTNGATVEGVNEVRDMVETVAASQREMIEILKSSQTQLRAAEERAAAAQKKLDEVQAQVQAANGRVDQMQRWMTWLVIAIVAVVALAVIVAILQWAFGRSTKTTTVRYNRQTA